MFVVFSFYPSQQYGRKDTYVHLHARFFRVWLFGSIVVCSRSALRQRLGFIAIIFDCIICFFRFSSLSTHLVRCI